MSLKVSTNTNNNFSTNKNLKANNSINFGASADAKAVIKQLPKYLRPLAHLTSFQENKSGLSNLRFIQDTTTNWIPKAVFSRSKADFAEFTFLEYVESALFYYAPSFVGELFKKGFSKLKLIPKNQEKHIYEPLINSIRKPDKDFDRQKVAPAKAAIVLACSCIPAAEYSLSFAKNLFTLKVFKKADFNNVANLEKNKKEDPKKQEKVERSAKNHLKAAGAFSLAGIGSAFALALLGHKFKPLQKLSEGILHPGAKIYAGLEKKGIKSEKLQNFLETYLNLDFDKSETTGKFCLSNGQLALSVISGVIGYFHAAKDRGKLDTMEVATRVPLVATYTIFGSSLIEPAFKKHLIKKGKFSELLKQDEKGKLYVEKLEKLPELAKAAAKKSGKTEREELVRLFKDKAKINLTPYGFSLLVMGFTLAGISRFWTQYRFNKGVGRTPDAKDFPNTNSSWLNSFNGRNIGQSGVFKDFLALDKSNPHAKEN